MSVNKPRAYGPVVESPANQSSFLPAAPLDILLSGKSTAVPILIGYCNREGIFAEYYAKLLGVEPIHVNFEDNVPYFLNLERGSDASKKVAEKIKQFYYGDEKPSRQSIEKFHLVMFVSE